MSGKFYIANAFSLAMLPRGQHDVQVVDLDGPGHLDGLEGAESVVGHADTAAIFTSELGIEVKFRADRPSIILEPGDRVLVGQFMGGRLPEGATKLPTGVSMRWMMVSVSSSR
jgi:hypothetical protein